jgi:N-methylhydantoinase A/oxoprolinase/acetone carboxylase beta subunit
VHEERYRTRSPKERIEFREWGIEAVGRPGIPESIFSPPAHGPALPSYRRPVLLGEGKPVEVDVHDRAGLAAGATVAGPAIIEDDLMTVLVAQGSTARMTAHGNVLVEIDAKD